MKFFALSALASIAAADVIFKETFNDDWNSKWVSSTYKGEEQGKFVLSAGKFYNDVEKDKGIQTSQDAKFYGISAKFDKFSNKDKDLVIQYQVKHEQGIDCGGGYVKLFSSDIDQKNLHGDSPYAIMFGPDICGSTRRVHAIFSYKGKNLLKKADIPLTPSEATHLYTLLVRSNNTYEVHVDMEKVAGGNLEDDWEFLLPKEIADPKAEKPEDWDERAKIPDPEDKEPEKTEEVPEFIADPDAKKPEDWDDEDDGEWEAPQIPNPEFKGAWSPRMIDNPAYKGKWEAPMIPNPEYKPADNLYLYEDISAIGIDIWQVKSGSIFDNVLVATSLDDAMTFATETFKETIVGEKKMADIAAEAEKEKLEKEAKEAEEAEKLAKEAKKDDEEVEAEAEAEEEVIAEEAKEDKPVKDEL